MHNVPLRPAAVLQQVAGGQDAQQAASLGEGNAGHAQQLGCCPPLKGAREERQQQQGVQELIWQGADNEANAPGITKHMSLLCCSGLVREKRRIGKTMP